MPITVDLEPTWVEVLNMVKAGADPNELLPALKLADAIRNAQKRGDLSITFTFTLDGFVEYDDGN